MTHIEKHLCVFVCLTQVDSTAPLTAAEVLFRRWGSVAQTWEERLVTVVGSSTARLPGKKVCEFLLGLSVKT